LILRAFNVFETNLDIYKFCTFYHGGHWWPGMALQVQLKAGLSQQFALIFLILNSKTTDHKKKESRGFACAPPGRIWKWQNGSLLCSLAKNSNVLLD